MPRLRTFATLVSLVALGSCADVPTAVESAEDVTGFAELYGHSSVDFATIFEREFVRERGRPTRETVTISTSGFEAPFRIVVRNGLPDGSKRVESASISVNGRKLKWPRRGRGRHHRSSFTRLLRPATSYVLRLELKGAPGSRLTIAIEGVQGATRFCPADVADGISYASLDSAIAATDTGGTVLVCDGVHSVPLTQVNRPITIRSENPGGATIEGSLSGAFSVGGYAQGTVRIADLTIRGGTFGIRIAHPVDTVVVDSSTFEPLPSVALLGNAVIALGSVPGDTTLVLLMNGNVMRFTNAPVNVAAATGVLINNTVDSTLGSGMILHSTQFARIAGNTFLRRGFGAGIRLESLGGTGVIEDNVMTRSGPAAGAVGILATNDVVVRRNQVIGLTPAPGYSWTIGIRSTARVAGVPRAEENVVQNANVGLLVDSTARGAVVRNNVVTGAMGGIVLGSRADSVRANRNDVTVTAVSFSLNSSGIGHDFTCNWWNTTSGAPAGAGAVHPSVYTPWSPVPIANLPGVICP